MRRAMLMVTGFGASGVMLLLFCLSVAAQCAPAQAAEASLPEVIRFPCEIEGTDLTAVQLARYEGPFWEDGSGEEVVDVAALVVENTGSLMAAEGAAVLEIGEDTLVFEFSCLPPGERVLVMEKDRQAARGVEASKCYGWVRWEYPEAAVGIGVEETGGCVMTVVNGNADRVPVTCICYKTYDAESGMYIGGVTYTALLRDLLPGERRQISPYHYAWGSSKVVQITSWVEE